ncbi:glycosyltransferase [Bacteroides xylanisolvens]|uniref:glycosyltransferase family 4 protein n=1 Tax=Bacteroides xylanisolvens TaxID=371601 RepID=UPI0021CF65A9|nr:glycosyltransferase family 4 protein [Bacteroides xylanisolvens]MCU4241736.1 glycosyltransferase [Bacteroides xylanisolvens]
MNILFINTLYSPHIGGGAEIICQEQVEGLKRRGYAVSVLTTSSNWGLCKEDVNGITVYRAGIKNFYWHFSNSKPNKYVRMLWHIRDIYNVGMRQYVKEVMQKEKPDVVICHNLAGFSISVWDEIKLRKTPIIQVLHDLYLLCPGSNMFKYGRACEKQCRICSLMRFCHRKKSKDINAVVGVSSYILERIKKSGYFSNAKARVIYNARNIPESSEYRGRDSEFSFRIGYIGTISKVKGVEWLIRTFMRLDINATLLIAGRGESIEYEEYLKKLASTDKRISFLGYMKPATFFSQIHLSIVPSIWPDTFPTVAIESCAYNVPVIATKVGGLPEIIHDGINGLLIKPLDDINLSNAIMNLYKNKTLLRSLSENSRNIITPLLDLDRMIDELIEVINEVSSSEKCLDN